MESELRQLLIEKLQRGEELPAEWARFLFPPEKREYELVYYGKQREEDLLADTLAVPLQPVRTFGKNGGDDWNNMLIFGDNLQVMKSLLEMKKAGKLCNADGTPGVRLIYIDPPFASRKEYAGSQDQKAYQDKLVGAQFVEFLRKRLVLLRDLLADDGSIYVHLDEKKSHYIKVMMDEILGEHHFQREIVWRIGWLSGFKTQAKNWIRNHDVLLFYVRGTRFIFNKDYIPYPKEYVRRDGSPPEGKGYPFEDTWNCYEIDNLNSIQIMSFSGEKTGFPTQKNENLLERIIKASSNKGDIVLDAFAGSGTACAVAEKLGRRWIGIDCSKLAIYTMQKRVLNLRKEIGNKGPKLDPKPFTLYNAGLYDFSELKELPWKSWRFFALQLFQCRDEPHKIGGVHLDGYLKGASVLVFNHTKNPGARFTEETLEEIHEALGSRVGNKVFIIAPALTFGFQQDYIDLDGVRYSMRCGFRIRSSTNCTSASSRR
jgi:DNA modification methylase